MVARKKQIQIDEDIFIKLCQYFIFGVTDNTLHQDIKQGLQAKIDKMILHDLYSTYKSAVTPEVKEQARQQYLDTIGIPEQFRW